MAMSKTVDQNNPVIFYDGVCNFCDFTINFIERIDKNKIFKFFPLQSNFAKEILSQNKIENDLSAVVLLFDNKVYYRSNAVIKIFSLLRFPYNLFSFLRILPTTFLDSFYNLIAKNRYSLFGKSKTCSANIF